MEELFKKLWDIVSPSISWRSLLTFTAGALAILFPFHYHEWFQRARRRQDAARHFRRAAQKIARELIDVDGQIAYNLPDRADRYGGMSLHRVREWTAKLRDDRAKLNDLGDQQLESFVEGTIESMHEYAERLHGYIESLRKYPRSAPSTGYVPTSQRTGLEGEAMDPHWIDMRKLEIAMAKYDRNPFLHFLPAPLPKDLRFSKAELEETKRRMEKRERAPIDDEEGEADEAPPSPTK